MINSLAKKIGYDLKDLVSPPDEESYDNVPVREAPQVQASSNNSKQVRKLINQPVSI